MRSSAEYILSKKYLVHRIKSLSCQLFLVRVATAVMVCMPYVLKPMKSIITMLNIFAGIILITAALLYAHYELSGRKRAYNKVLTNIIGENKEKM